MSDARSWQKEREPDAPRQGDAAPDFELRDVSGHHTVQLSAAWAEQPVALVFGSFT